MALAEDARIAALIGFTLAAIAVVLANTGVPQGQNGGPGPLAGGIVISGGAALLLAIVVFSRTRRPGRAGLVMGSVGLVTVVAFWSGLPFVLGSLAVALGRRATGRLATAAQAVGLIAVLAAAAVTVVDRF